MEYTTHEEWVSTMSLNLGGAIRVTEAFLPLISKDGGRIVNVSSGAAPSFVAKLAAERQTLFLERGEVRAHKTQWCLLGIPVLRTLHSPARVCSERRDADQPFLCWLSVLGIVGVSAIVF